MRVFNGYNYHPSVFIGPLISIRFAALAGPVAVFQRLIPGGVKNNVIRPGIGGARRFAENTGGLHRIIEQPVKFLILA